MRSTARTYALPARLLPLLVWGMACSIEPAHATGDPLGQHHSTGTQITPANVDTLAPAWTHRNGDMAATQGQPSSVSAQSTPILLPPQAGEHLVYCTPFNRVIALDPRTGRERWTYDPQVRRTSERPYRCRGVAYAEVPQVAVGAACRHRIYTATNDRRLVALDARDGKPCDGFGARGVVTLVEHERYGLEQVSTSSPPVVANGVVVVGSSVIDFAYAEAPRGVIAAFDAVTGAPRWTFDPLQGINGTGAANAWAPLAVDAERDLVFVPTGAPSPDYYGVLREGSNGHANAVVALRLATGEVAWAFQLVHHDLWDYDTPAQPVLFEWTAPDGRRVPALAQVSKQGFVFVLDRRDGTPLLPVQERAVPASTIAGERAWPTQPFPQQSLRLLPTRLTPNDAWGLTFWDRGKCRETLAGLRNEGIFTPLAEQPTLLFPGSLGGANWGGGAYSPRDAAPDRERERRAVRRATDPWSGRGRRGRTTRWPGRRPCSSPCRGRHTRWRWVRCCRRSASPAPRRRGASWWPSISRRAGSRGRCRSARCTRWGRSRCRGTSTGARPISAAASSPTAACSSSRRRWTGSSARSTCVTAASCGTTRCRSMRPPRR